MRQRIAAAWPLWSILAAQAVLTLPWLWHTAPFTDEALYIDAGSQEWAHFLHHAVLPNYAAWFSGAPIVYPPLAAAADSAGGLPAARALSLIFMLATTALVYLIGSRLFGRQSALCGALLFAVCGLVVHYGAFATFGPMALFLMVLATWAASRIRDGGAGWPAACAAALVAGSATKYATLAWDPVIIGIIVLHGWDKARWRALGQAASVGVTVLVSDLGLLMLGGANYSRGVIVTTVFRSIHWGTPSTSASVLLRAFALTGALVLPAILGVAVSLVRKSPLAATGLLALLVLAAVLAPIEQARIHQLPSLDKNMGFGLPFAALGAGYAMSAGTQWLTQHKPRARVAAVAAAVALVVGVLIAGRLQKVQFRGPSVVVAGKVVSAISQSYRHGTYILSDGAARMEQYYLPSIPSKRWIGSFTPSAALNNRIASWIRSCQISTIVLRLSGHAYDRPYDLNIVSLINRDKHYKLAAIAGQGSYSTQVWELDRSAAHTEGCT